MVRLRQIALVGQDIDWSANALTSLLDTYVAYRDPTIVPAFGGMFNVLLQIGDDCFLEVVSPTDGGYAENSTSVKSLRKNKGDCGYMAILQVDDVGETSAKLAKVGRAVLGTGLTIPAEVGGGVCGEKGYRYEIGSPMANKEPGTVGMVNVQWHPKDFGTLMETEEQWPSHQGPEGSWLPAGNRWQNKARGRKSSVCEEFAAVEIAVADPAAMARKWADGLDCPVHGSNLELDGSTVRFVPIGADGKQGVIGIALYATPGKPKAFDTVHLHGITWTLVDRSGGKSTAPLYDTLGAVAGKANL